MQEDDQPEDQIMEELTESGLVTVGPDSKPLTPQELSKQPYLSKPAAAIHVKVVQGKPSLLQAKLTNALLKVFQETPTETSGGYLTTRKWISMHSGYNSNDIGHLKKTADDLTNIKIQFDSTGNDSIQTVGVAQMFSAIIFRSDGVVYFEIPEVTKKIMRRTDTRGLIHMTVAQVFDSLYSYKLYENCVVYRTYGETPIWSIDQLKDFLQVEDESETYLEFKHFNAKIIKPSVMKVNKLSDIEVEPTYHRKNRAVQGISFTVRNKNQHMLEFDVVDEFLSLQERIVAFGVKDDVAAKLAREFTKEQILRNIAYTQDRMHKGKVADSAAFLIRAIQEDYAPKESEVEKKLRLKKEAEEAVSKEAESKEQNRRAKANETIRQANQAGMATYEAMDPEQQRDLLSAFEKQLKEKSSPTLPLYKKNGLSSKIVQQEFVAFMVLHGFSEPSPQK